MWRFLTGLGWFTIVQVMLSTAFDIRHEYGTSLWVWQSWAASFLAYAALVLFAVKAYPKLMDEQ